MFFMKCSSCASRAEPASGQNLCDNSASTSISAAAAKWAIDGPWEISLALRDTAGAALGDFAEGWAPFGDFRNDGTGCGEPHVLHRWTVDEIEPQALAFGAGDRIENSFGTTHQRYLAHRGSYEGQFDPCSVG